MTLRRWAISNFPLKSLVDGASNLWTASASGTNEYYYTGDLFQHIPNAVHIADTPTAISVNALGSLGAGEWSWGDNDTIGNDTIYVRLADGTDPDTKAADYIQCSEPLELLVTRMLETVLLSLQVASHAGASVDLVFFHVDSVDNVLHRWVRTVVTSPFDFEAKTVLELGDRLLVMADLEDVSVVASGDESGDTILKPTNNTPAHNATSVSVGPTLTSSIFSTDAEWKDQHAKSRFTIIDQTTGAVKYDSGEIADLVSHNVPGATLDYKKLYGWTVKHKGFKYPGVLSPESIMTLFETDSVPAIFAGQRKNIASVDMTTFLEQKKEDVGFEVPSVLYGADKYLYYAIDDGVWPEKAILRKVNPDTFVIENTLSDVSFFKLSPGKCLVWGTDGLIYAGTNVNGSSVHQINPDTMQILDTLALCGAVRGMSMGDDGNLYVVAGGVFDTDYGIYKINLSTFTILSSDINETTRYSDVVYGSDGNIYVGTDDGSVLKISPSDLSTVVGTYTDANLAVTLALEWGSDDILYVLGTHATHYARLHQVNPVTMAKGLVYEAAVTQIYYSLLYGFDGNLYAGGNDGKLSLFEHRGNRNHPGQYNHHCSCLAHSKNRSLCEKNIRGWTIGLSF
jgi:hypothetical protein